MAEQWLIDGYNLLHAFPSAFPGVESFSREKLFFLVSEFASFKKTPTLLVLDGVGNEDELKAYSTSYFSVVYSQKVPADAYIEKYMFEHRETMRVMVVTNDRAISNMARGSGAGVMSTPLFVEQLIQCQKETKNILNKENSKGLGFNRPFEDKLKDL